MKKHQQRSDVGVVILLNKVIVHSLKNVESNILHKLITRFSKINEVCFPGIPETAKLNKLALLTLLLLSHIYMIR